MTLPVNQIVQGSALEVLRTFPDDSVDCVVTSPPYWSLRSYIPTDSPDKSKELGLEPDFKTYIQNLIAIFTEVKRVLKPTGTCFVNLGDTYFGGGRNGGNTSGNQYKQHSVKGSMNVFDFSQCDYRAKCLVAIPERFVIAMIDAGWLYRNRIVWHKKNAMPSSVLDRFTNKHELVLFFTKSERYFFDIDAVRIPYESVENRAMGVVRAREKGYNTKQGTKQREEEEARRFGKRRPPSQQDGYARNPKGKNPGDVWSLTLQPHKERHIAMFPIKLISPMIRAGCPPNGVVLDPFMGAGSTALAARNQGRNFIGIELNPAYITLAEKRLAQQIIL